MPEKKILNARQVAIVQKQFGDYVINVRDDNVLWRARIPKYRITITIYNNKRLFLQGSNDNQQKFWEATKSFWNKNQFWKPMVAKPLSVSINDDQKLLCWGGDESGKGDYFGSIHLSLVQYTAKMQQFCQNWQLRDSKQMPDAEIIAKAQLILRQFPDQIQTSVIKPHEIQPHVNLNQLLAQKYWKLIHQIPRESIPIIIDGFTNQQNFGRYINQPNHYRLKNLQFVVRAESKYQAVAVAALISRFHFLQELKNYEQQYQIKLLRGASANAKQQAQTILDADNYPLTLKNLIKKRFLTAK